MFLFLIFSFFSGVVQCARNVQGTLQMSATVFSCLERSGMGLILTSSLHGLLSMAFRRQAGSSDSLTRTHTLLGSLERI